MRRSTTIAYTIKEIVTFEGYEDFFVDAALELQDIYGTRYNWGKFDITRYVYKGNGRAVVCLKGDRPVGFMLSKLVTSVFDPDVVILMQDLLYATPGTRAAHYLFKDFIDFGKSNANHIITMLAEHTNIKSKTLERIGFKKLETLYRME